MTRRAVHRLVLAVLAGGVAHLHAQETALTVRLQSAIVSKALQFVRWPAVAFNGRSSLEVCVVSTDPFAEPLQTLVAGDAVDGRPITVRVLDQEQDVDRCHALFLSTRAVHDRPALMQRAASRPILTFSDDDRFFDKGGIVRLRVIGGRMKFDVNLKSAQPVGLQISSQLLQLAATVRGQS